MKTKILYIVIHYNSKRDINGNCYWAARITRTRDGKSIELKTPHYSNLNSAMKDFTGGEWGRFYETTRELSIRDFNGMTKSWPYFGCTSIDIVPAIKKAFRKDNRRNCGG